MTAPIRRNVLLPILIAAVSAFYSTSVCLASTDGLYVWTDETSTPEARQALIDACLDPIHPLGIVLLSDHSPYGYATPERVANVRALNTLAHQAGVSVYALYTNKDWIDEVLQYNTECTDASQRFDAYAMDYEAVEPSTAAHLQYYAEAKAACGTLPLHVSLGWHWDSPIVYGGATKPAYQHLLDLVDSVDVQTVFDTAEQIEVRSQDEVRYATQLGKPLYPTIETQDVSGLGLAPWNTFFDDGESEMWNRLADVSFGTEVCTGFLLHYYGHAYNSGTETWPAHTVAADTEPPTISSVSASPNVLWPPNHKMVKVTVAVSATDNRDPAPVGRIVDVTANEPIDGSGGGKTQPDWEIVPGVPLTVKLRAERSGGGSGRVYTIHVECTDACGNVATGTAHVMVPHDQRQK